MSFRREVTPILPTRTCAGRVSLRGQLLLYMGQREVGQAQASLVFTG